MTNMTTTMKALAFTYNSDKVETVQVEKPVPLADQVQIKVHFSAMDTGFDDVLNRTWTGSFIHKIDKDKPLFLGWHYSGKVSAVGSNVKNLQAGDWVLGHLHHAPSTANGTLAEYIVVSADHCAKYDGEKVSGAVAAAATTECMTALQALRDHGHLVPKTGKEEAPPSVLVIGAAGGVGSAAVQIARTLGAHVTAVCSDRDVKRVQDLGAHVVWSRTQVPDPLSSDQRFDIIFDTPVVLSPVKAMKSLKKGGKYVTTLPTWGLLWGILASMFSSKGVHMVEVKPVGQDFATVSQWLASEGEDKLTIFIDSTYKIKDISQAWKRQHERKTGRVVIQVENGWMDG